MGTRLLAFYERLILKRPRLTLLVLAGLVLLLASKAPNIKLEASADALVLEGDKSLEIFREVNKRYGSEEFLLVTYTAYAPLFTETVLARIAQLRDELTVLPGVSSVLTILDVPLLYSPKVSLSNFSSGIQYLKDPDVDRRLVQKELSTSPIYKDLLTSRIGDTTAIQVNLTRDPQYDVLLKARDELREKHKTEGLSVEEKQQLKIVEQEFRSFSTLVAERQRSLVNRVREILVPYRDNATIFLGGVPMIAADMIRFIQSDLLIFGTGIIMFIIATLAIIFRSLRWVMLPLICCLMTVAGMLGYLTWIDWRMTVISSNFVALLLIITLSIAIHLVVRYRELHSAQPQASQFELVLATVRFMAKPCFYTSLTTIVAFASLVVSGIRPVIDFGWMMTIGVAAALLLTFMVLPAGILLLKKTKPVPATGKTVEVTLKFASFTESHGKLILIISAVLLLFSLWGISRLEVENRFIDYFHPATEIYRGMETIDRVLGGTIPLDIIIRADMSDSEINTNDAITEQSAEAWAEDDGAFDEVFGDEYDEEEEEDDFADEESGPYQQSYWFSRAGLDDIERIHNFLESIDETGKVLSLATLYKTTKDIAGADIDDIQLAIIKQNISGDIQRVMLDPYLSDDGNETRITVRVMETSHTLRRAELLALVKNFLTDEMELKEDNFDLTGMLVLYNNMLQSLYTSQIATLGAVFCAITAMFTLLFRSLYLALIAVTPNMLAAAMVLGGMGITGIPLDMMTITIAAITMGIGVDHSIHYIHRFISEFPKDRNYIDTMYRCHGSIGKAMYYTSITIIVGFSILALSNFTPSLYFGLLTSFAMFSALLGGLILLPQLLIVLKPLGKELLNAEQSTSPTEALVDGMS